MASSKELVRQYTVSRKIEYLYECFDYCNKIIQSFWNSVSGFETVVQISVLKHIDTSKHALRDPVNYPFDAEMPQLVFWCLDTDGLQISQKIMNHQHIHTNVKPLRPFVYTKGKKKEAYMQHPQHLDRRKTLMQVVNNVKSQSTDHFIILIQPNAEVLTYSMDMESKNKLRSKLSLKEQGRKHGTVQHVGVALMLKDSIMAPQAEIKDNMIKLVQKLFLENDKLFHNWNNDNHQELLKYIRPIRNDNFRDPNTYQGNILSGSLYLRKYKGAKIPLLKIRTKVNHSVRDALSIFKWTTYIDEESASMIWRNYIVVMVKR